MGKTYGENAGYTLIEWYVAGELGYVMGRRETDVAGYVTWAFRPDTPQEKFWGHYFDNQKSALNDYIARIDEEAALMKERTGNQPLHPKMCLSIEPSSGDLICIKRGLTGYYASDWNQPGEREHNQKTAEIMNKRWGVSIEQEQSMVAGSIFGWDVPAADPRSYEPEGAPRKPVRKRRPEQER